MDAVGGFAFANGTHAKDVTGIDDHCRMCVTPWLVAAERTHAMCGGLTHAPTRILVRRRDYFAVRCGAVSRTWTYGSGDTEIDPTNGCSIAKIR
jgi:hypothetical protein